MIRYLVITAVLVLTITSTTIGNEKIDFVNCTPNNTLCKRVVCAPLKECSGVIVDKGSRCGCCPVCVKILEKDEQCSDDSEPPGGPVPSTRCAPGLTCFKKICTSITNDPTSGRPCLGMRKHRKQQIDETASSLFPLRKDLWIPECDAEGYFIIKQCQHSRCFCVDKFHGKRIFGQEEVELSANMTCECSSTLHKRQEQLKEEGREAEYNTFEQEHCTTSGDYEKLQCYNDTCFCVDPQTGTPNGTMVKLKQRDLLYCYEAKLHKDSYLQRCEKQLITERRVLYDFHQKGIKIIGLIDIDCDPDGKYVRSLCQSDTCYCSDREGVSFGTYKKGKQDGQIDLKKQCRCARDEEDIISNHARYGHLKCDGFGNFDSFQCDGTECFCVDSNGDRVTDIKPVPDGINIRVICEEIRKKLNDDNVSKNPDTTTTVTSPVAG